jgi:hypothetical protein
VISSAFATEAVATMAIPANNAEILDAAFM